MATCPAGEFHRGLKRVRPSVAVTCHAPMDPAAGVWAERPRVTPLTGWTGLGIQNLRGLCRVNGPARHGPAGHGWARLGMARQGF